MLRQVARGARPGFLVARAAVARVSGVRHYADFETEFKKVAPILDVPHTPSSFMTKRPEVQASIPEKLTVNFVLPHEVPYSAKEVSHSRSLPLN